MDFADVFMRSTAAYRDAYDQYVEGSQYAEWGLESTRRDVFISLGVPSILSAASLSSGVYRGET
jgi:hypothetical protein